MVSWACQEAEELGLTPKAGPPGGQLMRYRCKVMEVIHRTTFYWVEADSVKGAAALARDGETEEEGDDPLDECVYERELIGFPVPDPL